MIVTRSQRRAIAYAVWMPEAFAAVVIGYGFLIGIGPELQVLFALSVSLLLTLIERLQAHQEFTSRQALAQEWLQQLTLRQMLDDLLRQLREGQDLRADWPKAIATAVADIKLASGDEDIKELFSGSRTIDHVAYPLVAILMFFGRIALGLGLALFVQIMMPSLANTITFQ
jgi:hypothetical protein